MVQIQFAQKLWSHFFQILTFWYQSRDHLKNVDRSTSSLVFDKFHLSTNRQPLKRNYFILMVKIKFGQKIWILSFQILTFWYQSRDHFKKVDCSPSILTFAKFHHWLIDNPKKGTYFILMVKIKFGQKLWSQFFKILAFSYQSRDHFKNVDCRSSSLIFAKFDLLANKQP